jgi:hypothetical protein
LTAQHVPSELDGDRAVKHRDRYQQPLTASFAQNDSRVPLERALGDPHLVAGHEGLTRHEAGAGALEPPELVKLPGQPIGLTDREEPDDDPARVGEASRRLRATKEYVARKQGQEGDALPAASGQNARQEREIVGNFTPGQMASEQLLLAAPDVRDLPRPTRRRKVEELSRRDLEFPFEQRHLWKHPES